MKEPPRDALCQVMVAMEEAGITRSDLIFRGLRHGTFFNRRFVG
jgi:hypothetical protein